MEELKSSIKSEVIEYLGVQIDKLDANKLSNETISTFIIKPKTQQESKVTKNEMLRKINPVESNLSLRKTKNASGGAVVVCCKDDVDSNKFKELATSNLSNDYEIKEVSTLNPRVKVVGMTEKLEEEELSDLIIAQNKNQINNSTNCKLISISPTRKNCNVYQAILQVDIITYHKLINQENVLKVTN
ncbi:unnamed protein product [Brassicogethes aeneus]|uniref:Uncharacterized protein n=1 Tax=Brassicogethes aeneus TaxID=1431903 RepID=A0A9P0FML0_BRAAE|nr:unnamed protein product [Brassicogethes aeneus]